MLTDWYSWRAIEKPNEIEDEDDEFDLDQILAQNEAEAGADDWEDV